MGQKILNNSSFIFKLLNLMLILQTCLPLRLSPPPNKFRALPHYGPWIRSPARRLRVRTKILQSHPEMNGFVGGGVEEGNDVSCAGGGFGGREDEHKDYDRDPKFAEILGSCLDDPDKAKSKMEERLRKKRNKILHTKTGSSV